MSNQDKLSTTLFLNFFNFMHSLYKVYKMNTQWGGVSAAACFISGTVQQIFIKFSIFSIAAHLLGND
jgi:uncharacterized membrane protein